MLKQESIQSMLNAIPAAGCSYDEWLRVGMALQTEGCGVDAWDAWSKADKRYKPGECAKKWSGFNGSVTGGTLVHIAREHGWQGTAQQDATRTQPARPVRQEKAEKKIVLPENTENCRYTEDMPAGPNIEDARAVITACFQPGELVNVVLESAYNSDRKKYGPAGIGITLERNELLKRLPKYMQAKRPGGAWLRINPVDGGGISNDNVAAWRHALIECDRIPIDEQEKLYRRARLPISALIASGGKSLHAWVKVDAASATEYNERVRWLYKVCAQCGIEVDTANKNPSRLSRLPGALRGDNVQKLVDTGIGCKSWSEWTEWIESLDTVEVDRVDEGVKPLENTASYIEDFFRGVQNSGPPIDTGFEKLNQALDGGFYDGLSILGAICSAGKTAFCMQLCDYIAAAGADVIVFSLEMGRKQLVARSISRETYQFAAAAGKLQYAKSAHGISSGHRYAGYSQKEKSAIREAAVRYQKGAGQHLYIYEGNAGTKVSEIRRVVGDHISRTGRKPFVFVDYLQLIAAEDVRVEQRQATEYAVSELKGISRDFDIPVLCISSLARDKYGKEVGLAAYKETGKIEYSADTLLGMQTRYDAESTYADAWSIEIKILKNRDAMKNLYVPFEYHAKYNHFSQDGDIYMKMPVKSDRQPETRAISFVYDQKTGSLHEK